MCLTVESHSKDDKIIVNQILTSYSEEYMLYTCFVCIGVASPIFAILFLLLPPQDGGRGGRG